MVRKLKHGAGCFLRLEISLHFTTPTNQFNSHSDIFTTHPSWRASSAANTARWVASVSYGPDQTLRGSPAATASTALHQTKITVAIPVAAVAAPYPRTGQAGRLGNDISCREAGNFDHLVARAMKFEFCR
jgi:hypothetical protein